MTAVINRYSSPSGGGYIFWACAAIIIVLNSGVRHDYPAYLGQWSLVLSGADPWSTDNAYGPVHNLLAPLIQIHWLAPKLVMGCALIVSLGMLFSRILKTRPSDHEAWVIFVIAGPANFLIIGVSFVYRSNDTLAASLVRSIFFPLLLVPFFMLDGNRLRFRLGLLAGLCFFTLMAAAFFYWGDSVLNPIFHDHTGPIAVYDFHAEVFS